MTMRANIMVKKETWKLFMELAKENDTTATQQIRIWIKEYINKNTQIETHESIL